VPPCELRVVGVGEMLGDDALQISVDHGPVQRPPFADDPVGEPNPMSRSGTVSPSAIISGVGRLAISATVPRQGRSAGSSPN
jgi:hypothetical protein